MLRIVRVLPENPPRSKKETEMLIWWSFFACGTSTPEDLPSKVASPPHQEVAAPTEVGKHKLALSLNKGKRWEMDEHTRDVMAEIQTLAGSAKPTNAAEAHAIAKELDTKMTTLIEGCNMEGPAHDQLHAFLRSFYPAMVDLENVKTPEDAASASAEIRLQLKAYSSTFE